MLFVLDLVVVKRPDDTIRGTEVHYRQHWDQSSRLNMSIIGIVAIDRNLAIGKGGKLPWHYSSDMKFFKQTTIGNAVVMGRRTWLTLNKPLKDRMNLVLSSRANVTSDTVVTLPDVESILALARSLARDL